MPKRGVLVMELEEYCIQKLVLDNKIQVEVPSEWIGQEVQITIKPMYLATAMSIVANLSLLTKELWWTSETDARWVVSYEGQTETETGLEKWVVDRFDLHQPIEGTTIDFFFKHVRAEPIDTKAAQDESAGQYSKLYDFFVTSFQKTLVLRSGSTEKTILVVGMTKQKSVIVLKTFAVET